MIRPIQIGGSVCATGGTESLSIIIPRRMRLRHVGLSLALNVTTIATIATYRVSAEVSLLPSGVSAVQQGSFGFVQRDGPICIAQLVFNQGTASTSIAPHWAFAETTPGLILEPQSVLWVHAYNSQFASAQTYVNAILTVE